MFHTAGISCSRFLRNAKTQKPVCQSFMTFIGFLRDLHSALRQRDMSVVTEYDMPFIPTQTLDFLYPSNLAMSTERPASPFSASIKIASR